MIPWPEVWAHVEATLGAPFTGGTVQSVGGGCINHAYIANAAAHTLFIKLNDAARVDMFAAEAEGLLEIQKTGAIRVPEPICWGSAGQYAYLVLEHIELRSAGEHTQALLGTQLARLHAHAAAKFGWHRDNTIGSTPQSNRPTQRWSEFWREQRLRPQLELARAHGASARLTDKLERLPDAVSDLLAGHTPSAALLHGDLWSGNVAADNHAQPVIFDPAVYYGDRETDLAMTELFGGFHAAFYQAYKSEYPLAAGYRTRRTLYNLYHVLNHFNLFGGGYAQQAERMTDELLSELRA